jgi:hypothetical protein
MTPAYVEVPRLGKSIRLPSVCVDDRTVIAQGQWLKIAAVMDEEFVEGEVVPDPEQFCAKVRGSNLGADVFTFAQKVPDLTPRQPYLLEWDDAAVLPISTFEDWWTNRATYDVRKAVKRAKKLGVVVDTAEFNDAFVHGICRIYNEDPVRQGTAFWHYQKPFDLVKKENGTYLERSAFIGAYYEGELIGFIRMVYVDTIARTLQVISRRQHFDKKPTNALIAKAVEICEAKGVSHLVYGHYAYNNHHSSLTEFKRRHGFEQVLLPRYYVPLTSKGILALKLKLHRGLVHRIPRSLADPIRKIRRVWYGRTARDS